VLYWVLESEDPISRSLSHYFFLPSNS